MKLTKEQLFNDLHIAFVDARKNKSSKEYVKIFEFNLKENLEILCDELWNRTYNPGPSSCFIVHHPSKREVFAAEFRDRIVHHLYFNYTHELFERTFISDSYSCIKNRGTHYGIHRLEKHIRQEGENYTKDCYVLKVDIRGYFMNISRDRLYEITLNSLDKMKYHLINKDKKQVWDDIIDYDFIKYLTKVIIYVDPISNCRIISRSDEWEGLSECKSMFSVRSKCGLPIGNLTSQLFSNIYLNLLDQYCKRVLKSKHYGRYVDDSYHVSCDLEFLKSIIKPIENFLREILYLEIHKGKIKIINVKYGVEFLGAFIKPYRTYINSSTLRRIKKNIANIDQKDDISIYRTINSYLGIMSHYSSYKLRVSIFTSIRILYNIGYFANNISKFTKYTSKL